MKCESEQHPEFKDKECQCADCRRLDYFCVDNPCYLCEGPVTDCDKEPEEDIIASCKDLS